MTTTNRDAGQPAMSPLEILQAARERLHAEEWSRDGYTYRRGGRLTFPSIALVICRLAYPEAEPVWHRLVDDRHPEWERWEYAVAVTPTPGAAPVAAWVEAERLLGISGYVARELLGASHWPALGRGLDRVETFLAEQAAAATATRD